MHTCTRCGNSLSVNDGFCSKCGIASNNYPAPTVQREEGKLDLSRLAKIIIIAGLLVASYGGLIFALNLPVSTSTSQNSNSEDFYQNVKEHYRTENLADENRQRGGRRGEGIRIILYGSAIALVGIVIVASIKKR